MSETRPGNAVPNTFFVDRDVTERVRNAAMTSRVQYGPRKRDRITFRASELGNVVSALDQKGMPAGCPVRVFCSFHEDKYKAAPLDADAILNFRQGDLQERDAEMLLKEAGLLAESHVKFGAWDPNASNARWRADPRYPDRSGGRIRGDCDFILKHPELGNIPLDWKSSSSFSYKSLYKVGAKPDNSVQVAWYAYEMGTEFYAVGYVNKEDGQIVILTYETPKEWIETVLFPACDALKAAIIAGERPPRPEGTRKAEHINDRVWPCFTYSPKKKRTFACPFYSECYGVAPPQPGDRPPRKPRARKAPAKAATTSTGRKKIIPRSKRAAPAEGGFDMEA